MGEGYYKYWGKADKEGNYHLLPYHCLDVAAVAWHLLKPETQRCKDLSVQTGLSPELTRYLIVLALMLHDLGKFSLTFQGLIPELFQKLFPECTAGKYQERHDTMGFVVWREHLKGYILKFNASMAELLDYFIRASFGHHGLPPKESTRGGNQELRAETFFRREEIECVNEYCKDCLSVLTEQPAMPGEWKLYKKKMRAISWNIAGLGVIADWIGSNDQFFPYISQPLQLSEYWQDIALPQASKALEVVGWKTHNPNNFHGKTYLASLFPFITEATPLQDLALSIPLMEGPKLFILEDVTGSGKTEAAMILSARIMERGDADGLYVGMPTMATANAMYERMHEAYRKLYKDVEIPSLVLSHGARHLVPNFTETVVAHQQRKDMYYENEQTASAVCNEWFADNRKKALLADVGVGTIDQVLLGVLPARHQSLRLLGLQRKILIIDEVHAYDPYMEHLLEVLLEAHARGGGSAILLSATIPIKKRNDLMDAFRKGLSVNEDENLFSGEMAFPLVIQAGLSGTKTYPTDTRREVRRAVGVSFLHDYEKVLQFIEQKASAGECVCWIRNTVKDARKTYQDLKKRGIISLDRLDLFHSRFAMVDRARIESNTKDYFGKKSGQEERKSRVLISTQVVEQSLDLDFDQMITDLAPIDLLIQRAGRLHRHTRDQFGNRIEGETVTDKRTPPIIHIFSREFDEKADSKWLAGEFAGTLAVYRNPGNLWRTQRILAEKKGWKMPEEARELIEAVYGDENGPEIPLGLQGQVIKAEGEDQSKESMGHLNALVLEKGYCRNAVKADQWDDEERIPTRLAQDNTEVVLAVVENGKIIPFAEAVKYPWDWSCLSISLSDWKKTGYSLPEEYERQVQELKETFPRLKYSNFVIATKKSGKALESDQPISEVYDPRFGWGKDHEKE
jgi:CRISPR-associated endonuclease/helicase Cas3